MLQTLQRNFLALTFHLQIVNIYSYGITIKAGFDFNEIEWNEKGNTIEVKLPEVKILSSEIDQDSFKVYHEDESVFNQITLEENNDAVVGLKKQAETDAIESGLFENARGNAETILTSFLEMYMI